MNDTCMVIDGDALDDLDDVSPEARASGLTSTLGSAAVQDVLTNLEAQLQGAALVAQLAALNYFVANDAFISLPPA